MSASTHPSKRRRLNDAASTLSKPFKSPLKATDQGGNDCGKANISRDQQHANTTSSTTNHRRPTNPASITTVQRSKTSPTQDELKSNPQFLSLQKQHSALLLQLTTLRHSLSIAQQAVKITSSSSSSSNHDLESLILKWKLASREAAEEVFSGARERVTGMGGVGAWRERSRENAKVNWDGDERQQVPPDDEQKENWENQREEQEEERRKYEPQEAADARDDDEQSFTMDMMLRSMNIDLDVIGYDKENQRWCD